jgi:hypothetical protein
MELYLYDTSLKGVRFRHRGNLKVRSSYSWENSFPACLSKDTGWAPETVKRKLVRSLAGI